MLNYIHWDVISWMLMFNSQIVAVFSAALQPKKMRGGHGDETQALNYGSRTFYPLYMTIGNLPKDIRRKMRAFRLAAYLPVLEGTKAEKKKMTKINLKGQILHRCLQSIMESIIEPGKKYRFHHPLLRLKCQQRQM